MSATRQIHSTSSMLEIEEAGGHSPSLAEAVEWYHLPGRGDLEGNGRWGKMCSFSEKRLSG